MAGLTKEQQAAVRHQQGCACVIAGAGTGKTRALSERLRFLVAERGLRPERVLATTFTRKATAELYRKAFDGLGQPAQRLKITTIDALIGELADEMVGRGLMPPVRVSEDGEQRLLRLRAAWDIFGRGRAGSWRAWAEGARRFGLMGLLEECLDAAAADESDKESRLQAVRSRLEGLRARCPPTDDFVPPSTEELPRFLRRFRELSDQQATIGYDVLARRLFSCLKRREAITAELAAHFDAILVDEFQDTSRVQAEILVLLSGQQGHLWVVGDPCQQIYAWRGAWRENLQWLIEQTGATVYRLTENFRSRQPILDAAYRWLSSQAAPLVETGMLSPLASYREQAGDPGLPYPVFTGTREQAFDFLRQLLAARGPLRPCDIAILCRSLTPGMTRKLEAAAGAWGLTLQYHTSRADRTLDATIGELPASRPGRALPDLYEHPLIDRLISNALRTTDFTALRALRPLAAAADAYDSTMPPGEFTLREAWPALEKTTDREIAVTPAVVSQPDAIQVMTIHAAKGLEFPVVVVMELREGERSPFPDPGNPEDAQLLYVAATRARDLLVLAHSSSKPHRTLSAFGPGLAPLPWKGGGLFTPEIAVPDVVSPPPVIKATDLGLYEQCRLRFASIHEGRYLPVWAIPQSLGARVHKAWELWARMGMPDDEPSIAQCLERGIRVGDSPQRKLPAASRSDLERAYRGMLGYSRAAWKNVLAVEHRYTYVHGSMGQVEGVADAVMETRDGAIVLVE
jgi:superfamily I DNA/RNA helicase